MKLYTETSWVPAISSSKSWQFANTIKNYLGLLLFGTATVTQLLATLGMNKALNETVWNMGVQLGGMGLTIVYGLLMYLAKQDNYKKLTDATTGSLARDSFSYLSFDYSGFLGVLAMVYVAWGSNRDIWKQGMMVIEEPTAEEGEEEAGEEEADEATEEESPESDEAAGEVITDIDSFFSM
mmetsp:Transcript_9546/g.11762  ORF Transcript_9546/g.11762 Transcript_9546/m.11762 type:complete len:181 (-) Transcript_9546:189-731(-)|eukprot:CAMPEP_0170462016 /NCGR_PEP_ID=MMETSP0123-20130129/7687_1 /TAXON_ID=182087 /ORGANISM="Favella ehrenbergii, Strain Fehren 1" /LENGTH=180 /DNA_ID=CAMNT_0010727145 /DNA_START=233 /DNA_END=775 /DNA_ORIENTATION=+